MGDVYDAAPPGWGNRGPTLEQRIRVLEERVKRLENKDRKLLPSPYDLGAQK